MDKMVKIEGTFKLSFIPASLNQARDADEMHLRMKSGNADLGLMIDASMTPEQVGTSFLAMMVEIESKHD